MALVVCRECGGKVSDSAPACPHCGFPQTSLDSPSIPSYQSPAEVKGKSVRSGCLAAVLVVVGLVIVLLVLSNLPRGHGGKASTDGDSTSRALKSEQENLLRDVKDPSIPLATRAVRAEYLIEKYPATAEAAEAKQLIEQIRAQQETANQEAAKLAAESIGKQWSYSTFKDDMTSKTGYSASVTSTNSFEFEFPYQGKQHARLTLRKHPRWGNDILFSIEKGQILCHSYGDCSVRVRFDEGPAMTLTGTDPSDNSTETVFIPGFQRFSSQLAKAKTVRIEVNVFHQGALTATFDVSGFDPKRLSSAQ